MRARPLVFLAWAVGCMPALAADALGRLFFTPEQRALFDQARQDNVPEEGVSSLRLDGRVERSGGKPAVWINGRLRLEARLAPAAALRVGESVDPATQERSDVVPAGSITPSTPR